MDYFLHIFNQFKLSDLYFTKTIASFETKIRGVLILMGMIISRGDRSTMYEFYSIQFIFLTVKLVLQRS